MRYGRDGEREERETLRQIDRDTQRHREGGRGRGKEGGKEREGERERGREGGGRERDSINLIFYRLAIVLHNETVLSLGILSTNPNSTQTNVQEWRTC